MKFWKMRAAKRALKIRQSEEAVEEVSKKLSMMREQCTVHMIEMERICPSLPHIDRKETDEMGNLCESIIRYGLLQPLTVRRVCKDGAAFGGVFTLICGYRRYSALKALGISKAPCIIVDIPASVAPYAAISEKMTNVQPDFFDAQKITDDLTRGSCESFEENCKRLTIKGDIRKELEGSRRLYENEVQFLREVASAKELRRNCARLPQKDSEDYLARLKEAYMQTGEKYNECENGIRRQILCRDVTPLRNSVEKLVAAMRNAGINANWTSSENEEGYQVTINVPRYSYRQVKGAGKR